MKSLATNRHLHPGRNFEKGSSYASSEFVGLIAPIKDNQSEDSIRMIFFEETGFSPQFTGKSADFVVMMSLSARTEVVHDPVLGETLVLHGEVYPDSEQRRGVGGQFVLNTFKEQGIYQTASNINGSYAALFVTPKEVSIVIDRVGSRKIFFSQDARGFWITTSLALQPRRKTDAAGVASLIINRYQYAGRTLYENVRTLERANIHTVTPRGLVSRSYWQYGFAEARTESFVNKLGDKKLELANLIQRAVHRRMPRSGKMWCSLSGGTDSRAILGALLSMKEEWPAPVRAISYGLSEDDDPAVARDLSLFAGIVHKLVNFRGSLAAIIKENGEHCEGLVFFYLHALSGIQQAAADFSEGDVLFVGDECFGWNDMPLTSFNETLQKGIGIRSPATVPSYYSYGQASHKDIQATLQADIDTIKLRCGAMNSWDDLKDYLYLDQRLSNMLLPWREFYNGRYISVANPLIDDEILEFMKAVPTSYRLDKRFFREAARAAYPELFKFRMARPGGNNMNVLESLFNQEKASLELLISSFDSDLDEVIPPDVVMFGLIDLLDRMTLARIPIPPRLQKVAEKVRRKLSRVRFYLRGPIRRASQRDNYGHMSLSPLQMVTLLQLRYLLRTPEDTARNRYPAHR